MDKHLILQVIPLFRDSTNLTAIKNCVDLIYGYGFKIKSLMLDREFYSAEIFSYLKESEIPHIVPVKKNSDELKRQLKGKKSKSFEYVINAKSKNKLKCKVKIVDRVIYMKGKKGKKGALHRAFVVYKINTSPNQLVSDTGIDLPLNQHMSLIINSK
ncbi:transposase [Methanoplanus limicola]|nr:transposase [Methanoplanus limicola]